MNRALQEAQSTWKVSLCAEQAELRTTLHALDVPAVQCAETDADLQQDTVSPQAGVDTPWEAPSEMEEPPEGDLSFARQAEAMVPSTQEKPQVCGEKKAAKPPASRKKGKRNVWFEGVKHKVVLGELFTAKEVADLSTLSIESGRVNIIGIPMKPEFRPTRTKERSICTLYVTDHYGTITVKWMMDTKVAEKAIKVLGRGGKVGWNKDE